MSNQLAVLAGGAPAIAGQRKSLFNAAAQANVTASFAIVGYKGKVWSLKYRGENTVLKDERNLPLQALDVVMVGVASGISKQFYEKGFVEGDAAAPDCFSVNGVTPDPSAPKKQCATCAICPKNQWGSKISDQGSKGKACQDSRRVALVPDGDLNNEQYGGPVMMRLPTMTLANFAAYGAMLEKRGAGMEYVVTRMTFDYDVAYPRIKFEPVRWLTQEEAVLIVGPDGHGGMCANPQIERMLNEAAEEVAHDPGTAAADPLAQGGPAAVFSAPALSAPPAAVPAPAAGRVAAVAADVVRSVPAAPVAPKTGGFGGGSLQPQVKASGFGGAAHTPAPVHVAPEAPLDTTPAPIAQARLVQGAPSDMESAIDDLLNAPI